MMIGELDYEKAPTSATNCRLCYIDKEKERTIKKGEYRLKVSVPSGRWYDRTYYCKKHAKVMIDIYLGELTDIKNMIDKIEEEIIKVNKKEEVCLYGD